MSDEPTQAPESEPAPAPALQIGRPPFSPEKRSRILYDKQLRGGRLCMLRIQVGWNQDRLGAELDRTGSTVSTWERGKCWAPEKAFQLLERVLKDRALESEFSEGTGSGRKKRPLGSNPVERDAGFVRALDDDEALCPGSSGKTAGKNAHGAAASAAK